MTHANQCEQIEPLLSAYIDGESNAPDTASVERHLEHCDDCVAAVAELRAWDADLRATLAPQDTAGAAKRIRRAVGVRAAPRSSGGRSASGWLAAVCCAAAAATLVAVSWRPDRPVPAPPPVPVTLTAARVVASTGEIDVRDARGDWRRLPAGQTLAITAGSRLRTPPETLCEIETRRQGTLRLNRDSEVIVHDAEHVELVDGQMWCRAPADGTLKVAVPTKADAAQEESWSLDSSEADELLWSVSQGAAEVHSLGGKTATLGCGPYQCPLTPGTSASVRPDQASPHVQPADTQDAVIWQLPLLHGRSEVSGELDRMLESVLSRIGQTKAAYLYEQQIRALGPAGAAPLLAYVRSPRALQQPDLRLRAMRIGSETADAALLDVLRDLQSDSDPQVSRLAAEAVSRLED